MKVLVILTNSLFVARPFFIKNNYLCSKLTRTNNNQYEKALPFLHSDDSLSFSDSL